MERRSRWFWVGVVLLSISALLWLIIIVGIATQPQEAGDAILGIIVITVIPIGIGIYCVRRGKKAAAIEAERQRTEGVYPSEPQKKHKTIIAVIGFIISFIGVLAWQFFDFILELIVLD